MTLTRLPVRLRARRADMLRIVLEDCLVVLVARDEVMVLFAFLARVSGYCTALLGVSRSTEREPRNGALLCSLPGSR